MRGESVEPQDSIVTIAGFDMPTDAHLARTALEAEGIDAIVVNDGVVNLSLYAALPERIVRLQVRASDVERARRVLGLNPPAASSCETWP